MISLKRFQIHYLYTSATTLLTILLTRLLTGLLTGLLTTLTVSYHSVSYHSVFFSDRQIACQALHWLPFCSSLHLKFDQIKALVLYCQTLLKFRALPSIVIKPKIDCVRTDGKGSADNWQRLNLSAASFVGGEQTVEGEREMEK